MRLCEALVTAFALNTKARLDQNVFVYRLTFRWPKSDCDVDNCTSKYYLLLLALVCRTWTCELSGWVVYLTSNIPLVKITLLRQSLMRIFNRFFLNDARTTFPLYKKERERRSRAFPSDSNPALLPRRGRAFARLAVVTHSYDAARNTATVLTMNSLLCYSWSVTVQASSQQRTSRAPAVVAR